MEANPIPGLHNSVPPCLRGGQGWGAMIATNKWSGVSAGWTCAFLLLVSAFFLPTITLADDPCSEATEKLSAFERGAESERYDLDLRHSNDETAIDQAKQHESRMVQSMIPSYAGEVKMGQPQADEAEEDLDRVKSARSK